MNDITMNINADHLIRQALQEDITSEDITTNAVMREEKKGEVQMCIRDRHNTPMGNRFISRNSKFAF